MEGGRSVSKLNLHERSLERLGADGRTIIERSFKKYVSIREIVLIRFRIGIYEEPF